MALLARSLSPPIFAFQGRRAAEVAAWQPDGAYERDELQLDDQGTAWFGERVSLRRVLVGMIGETARHAGHADILRELLDGATGAHRPE